MNMNETMSDTADTAVAKVRPMMDKLSTMASQAADKAYDMKGQAKEWMGSKTEEMTARQKEMVEQASKYISANPFKALAMAVLAALVVGRLMK